MRKIRVLIVDDAVVARRIVAELLSADPELEVAGMAANGRIALAKVAQLDPDLVTLDLEMPDMDGLETLAALRKAHPHLPVVMLSRYTRRAAVATLDALAGGACDYVTLPEASEGSAATVQAIREQLIPKIKQQAARHVGDKPRPAPARSRPLSDNGLSARPRIEVVAIGASTGGPNALGTVVPGFPSGWPVPTLIVQHMPPVFTRQLAERLSVKSHIPFREATAGACLAPGEGWVAPGDYHLQVARDEASVRLHVHQGPPEHSCRPSVDQLFRSVAAAYGPAALAVVLTGMGQDGLRGCEAIRAAGGQVLAQDEPTSVVWGMPGFVARAGLEIGPEIVRRVMKGRSPSFVIFSPTTP